MQARRQEGDLEQIFPLPCSEGAKPADTFISELTPQNSHFKLSKSCLLPKERKGKGNAICRMLALY